jgi:NAD(P)-dependent dehydrogenase (short-subunit alcohol dehydrogenase family)
LLLFFRTEDFSLTCAALVTGGGRRIGAVVARTLAEAGYAVAIHANRSMEEAEALAASLRAAGHQAQALAADLADRTAVQGLVPACAAAVGPLTVLVNNAASFHYDTAQDFSAADLDFHLRPNLEAPLLLARDFTRALGDRQGVIVNMLDHKVTALNPDFFTYTVAKIGLEGATRLLAMALRGRVRVNGVAPGITLVSGKQTEAGFAKAWSAPPLGRSATPAELADAVLYCVTARALTGQVLVLDGGDGLLARERDIAFEKGKEESTSF